MKKVIIALIIISLTSVQSYSKEEQPDIINKILQSENNATQKTDIKYIINTIDNIYGDLYDKLSDGKKITVFFDPAHGRLKSGAWQGAVTWRMSAKEKPEEMYSMPLARELYKRMSTNKYIEVVSTDDYLEMLNGTTDEYSDISFNDTIQMAYNSNAFIIVSSHLNNISPIHKAEGRVNMLGIHVTCDEYGNKYLTHVKQVYKGFLTLYNKFDASGFTRSYALNIKDQLVANNMTANNWDNGAVADDRFIYFSDYPFSVIYESGFISNYEEEEFLSQKSNQEMIAEAQYKTFIKTLDEKFGVSINNSKLKKTGYPDEELTNIIKISRITLYYIKKKDVNAAIYLCNVLEKRYEGTPYEDQIKYYSYMKERLISYNVNVNKAKQFYKKKSYGKAGEYYKKAIKSLGYNPVFANLNRSAYLTYTGLPLPKKQASQAPQQKKLTHPPSFTPLTMAKEKHSLKTPFILTIKEGQSLEEAIDSSFAPHSDIKNALQESITNGKIRTTVWDKKYSKKTKKYTKVKKEKTVTVNFTEGIYIVRLDKNMNLVDAKRVGRVAFDPKKYQNQEYFKNSCLAVSKKYRSL